MKVNIFYKLARKYLVIGAISGGLIVASLIFSLPKYYLASATHIIAAVNNQDVQPPIVLAEMMKYDSFLGQDVYQKCNDLEKNNGLIFDVKPNKMIPSSINISTLDENPSYAEDCLRLILLKVDEYETSVMKEVVDDVKLKVSIIDQALDGVKKNPSPGSLGFQISSEAKKMELLSSIAIIRKPKILFDQVSLISISKINQINLLKILLGSLIGCGFMATIFVIKHKLKINEFISGY